MLRDTTNLEPDTELGDFRIVRRIGAGGMGIVYEARQVSLNRPVALKVLPPGVGLTEAARQRFHREARAAARLHHSHIVAVYAEGEHGGVCYYAMELVEGDAFDRIIADLRATSAKHPEAVDSREATVNARELGENEPDEPASSSITSDSDSALSSSPSGRKRFDTIAGWIAATADALQYAHSQGVIHRDVKPSNLMVGRDGRVRLMDFGLARVLDEPGMTVSGQMLGTPRYMSPEQITAGRMPVDHRTDMYSLGATLYEFLTLRPPFAGESRDQIIAQIISKEPRRPRQIDRQIPVDLETICLKSLEKDPDRRYQSASEMASDLRRYIDRYSIHAKRIGPIGRAIKWVRRRPGIAASIACVLIAVAVAGVLAHRAHQSEQARIAAEQQRLEERRQHLRETAMLESMSGNFQQAEAAINEAERLGELAGWVHMLRGQLAVYRHDQDEAMRLLKLATREMPDNAAAHALLTHAYLTFEGGIGSFQEGVRQLDRFEFVTSEDYLFAGQAVAVVDPARGIRLLNEAIKYRKSALGYIISSHVRSVYALATGEPGPAEEAVKHASFAQDMLENHSRACAMRLYSHMAAAIVYRNLGRQALVERHLADAAQAERALDAVGDRSDSWERLARGFYFDFIDDDQNALAVYRREVEQGNIFANKLCTYLLYRQKQYQEALRVADRAGERLKGDSLEVSRLFVLAEVEGPDGARQAFEEMAQRARSKESLPYYPTLSYAGILRVLGKNSEADKFISELRDSIQPPLEKEMAEYYRALVNYNCGLISDEQLLEKAGPWLVTHADAHFHIGLRRLADGDRNAARDNFRAAKLKGAPPSYEWYWSWAFLKRLEEDPDWPPWIDTKQPPTVDAPKPPRPSLPSDGA